MQFIVPTIWVLSVKNLGEISIVIDLFALYCKTEVARAINDKEMDKKNSLLWIISIPKI